MAFVRTTGRAEHRVAGHRVRSRRRAGLLACLLALPLALGGCQSGTVANYEPARPQARSVPPPQLAEKPAEAPPPPPAPAAAAADTAAGPPPGPFTPGVSAPGLEARGYTLMRPDSGGPVRIGLLLPLTGRAGEVGQSMLDAATLALHEVGGDRIQLLPRDTGGDPARAAAAVDEVLQAGAELVLGPLLRESVLAAAVPARARGVNLVAFSTDATVAGDNVFLMGFTPAGEVERVVRYAVGRGLTRFAALSPATNYGDAVLQAMQGALALAGGELVHVETYAADGSDAEAAARRLADRRGEPLPVPDGRLVRGRPVMNPFVFDALMLPEGGGVLRAVVPYLPYFDIDPDKVRYVGTGLWNRDGIGREPAMVGGWFAGPAPEGRAAFVDRFAKAYGRPPHGLASLAYDATALAAVLAQAGGPNRFEREAIADPSGFYGVDGVFRFQPSGIAERGLAVLEIRPDGLRVIDPAPESFRTLGF